MKPLTGPRASRNLAVLSWQASMYAAGWVPVVGSRLTWSTVTLTAKKVEVFWREATFNAIKELCDQYGQARISCLRLACPPHLIGETRP